MHKEIKKYGIQNLVLTGIIIILSFLIFFFLLTPYYLNVYPILLVFIVLINMLSHSIMIKSYEKDRNKFLSSYIQVFALKFFGILIFVLIYLLVNKENIVSFVITLFILYLIYTIFEVYSFVHFIKRQDKKLAK